MNSFGERGSLTAERKLERLTLVDEYGLEETRESPNHPKSTKTDDREAAFNQNAQMMRELLMISRENSSAKDLIRKRLGESKVDESSKQLDKKPDRFATPNQTPGCSRTTSARKRNPSLVGQLAASLGVEDRMMIAKPKTTKPASVAGTSFTFGAIPSLDSTQHPSIQRNFQPKAENLIQTTRIEAQNKKILSSKSNRVSPTKVRPIQMSRAEPSQASEDKTNNPEEPLFIKRKTPAVNSEDLETNDLGRKMHEPNRYPTQQPHASSSSKQLDTKKEVNSPGFPTKEDFKRLQMRRLKMGRISSTIDDLSKQSAGKSTSVARSPSKASQTSTGRRSDRFNLHSDQFYQSRIFKTSGSSNLKNSELKKSPSRSPSNPTRSRCSSSKMHKSQRASLVPDCRNSSPVCSPMITPTGKHMKRIEFNNLSPGKANRQAEYDLNPISHLLNIKSASKPNDRRTAVPSGSFTQSSRSGSKLLGSKLQDRSGWRPNLNTNNISSHRPKVEPKMFAMQQFDHKTSTNVLLDLVMQKKLLNADIPFRSFHKASGQAATGASFFKQPRDSVTTEDSVRVLQVVPTPQETGSYSLPSEGGKVLTPQSRAAKETKGGRVAGQQRDSISITQTDQSLESMFQSVLMKTEAFHSSVLS